ncbi:EamA family transporter, partial [Streptomyces sp. SID625]|nr:EamA family transporter [Streptomyces sp. SID625]
PLVATLLGVLLLGERLGAPAITGAVLLLGGLVLVSVPARWGRADEPSRE